MNLKKQQSHQQISRLDLSALESFPSTIKFYRSWF